MTRDRQPKFEPWHTFVSCFCLFFSVQLFFIALKLVLENAPDLSLAFCIVAFFGIASLLLIRDVLRQLRLFLSARAKPER